MRLNNSGFAITGILYTVFVLFLMILLSVLSGLNIKRQLLEKNMENIKGSLEERCEVVSLELVGYTTKYQGQYTIRLNGSLDYVTYLSKGETLSIVDNKIIGNNIGEIDFVYKNPVNVDNAKIVKICTVDRVQ